MPSRGVIPDREQIAAIFISLFSEPLHIAISRLSLRHCYALSLRSRLLLTGAAQAATQHAYLGRTAGAL